MEPFNPARFASEFTPEQAAALIAGAESWQTSIVLERMRQAFEQARLCTYGTPEPIPPDWPITIPGLVSQELAKAIHKGKQAGNAWPLVAWCESSASAFELQRFSPSAIAVWLAREELPSACDFGQGGFDTYRPWLPAPVAEPEPAPATPPAPAETAQEQPPPAPAPVQQAATKKGLPRQDLLTPLINKAVQEAGEGASPAEVFAVLRAWADQKRAPLIGATEEGLKWIDSSDRAKFLSLDALGKRLKRAA